MGRSNFLSSIIDRKRDALDRLIAAQAISLGVTLVTNNESDFKDYSGLIMETGSNESDPSHSSKPWWGGHRQESWGWFMNRNRDLFPIIVVCLLF